MNSPFGTFSLADIAMQTEQIGALRDQRQARRTEAESTAKLTSLLPQAMQGDAQARQDVLSIGTPQALEWWMRLDDRDKAKAKDQVTDAVQGLRWADTPEKFAQFTQFYRSQGMNIPDVPFEMREQIALELGEIGSYMESAPKLDIRATEPGGGLYGVNPHTGDTRILVQPNPGDAPMGQQGTQEGATATNPQTGEKIEFRNGQWVPMGGGASNGTGSF